MSAMGTLTALTKRHFPLQLGSKSSIVRSLQKSRNMVYIDDAVDITADVIKKYDAQLKK